MFCFYSFSIQDRYYEIYRACLKTIAIVGRQFKTLINDNNSTLRWLLMRTQAIGDAGESDSAIKLDLQKLKARIKEIYHRKFFWNNTRLGVDGLLIYVKEKCYLVYFLEVQEVLGTLKSPDDLLSLWNATYEIASPMRDYYSTLIAVQNQQAKQNRTSAVTHSHI
jgi:hypothetical protein